MKIREKERRKKRKKVFVTHSLNCVYQITELILIFIWQTEKERDRQEGGKRERDRQEERDRYHKLDIAICIDSLNCDLISIPPTSSLHSFLPVLFSLSIFFLLSFFLLLSLSLLSLYSESVVVLFFFSLSLNRFMKESDRNRKNHERRNSMMNDIWSREREKKKKFLISFLRFLDSWFGFSIEKETIFVTSETNPFSSLSLCLWIPFFFLFLPLPNFFLPNIFSFQNPIN